MINAENYEILKKFNYHDDWVTSIIGVKLKNWEIIISGGGLGDASIIFTDMST